MIAASILVMAASALVAADDPNEGNTLPDKLKPSRENVVLFQAKAEGFQVYVCKSKADDPKKFEWSLKAPDASLVDAAGKKIGKHYAGPAWEANDGSKVVGKLLEKVAAPKGGDIPWLLLKAEKNTGKGLFANVAFIQRINTEGGIAPTESCDQAHEGNEMRVKYKATYIFLGTQK